MDAREHERSCQHLLQPLVAADRALQVARRIREDIIELEDALEDLPLTISVQNLVVTRRALDGVVFSLELEYLQRMLRLRHEIHNHRLVFGRLPAIGLR